MTEALAFICWMGMLGANGLAKQHKLPVGVAVWIPNAVFALIGIVLLSRLERPGDRDWMGRAPNWIPTMWAKLRGRLPVAGSQVRLRSRGWRLVLMSQLVDG